jgi:uncharacterized YccA/Bax inhibitor family protein
MMRTANPALNAKTFAAFQPVDEAQVMTLSGTVNKTFLMLLLLVITASLVWRASFSAQTINVTPWILMGAIGGFIIALITIFKKQWSAITAPIYALLEGLFLGGISAVFEFQYPGIVIQAVGLTFGTLFCLLLAYKSGFIKVTNNFRLGIVAATGGIALVYLIGFALNLFKISPPFINQGGTVGIIFSVIVVVIAALNLVLDFDFIEKGAETGAPKFMEWYAAFGLTVTLIWLYVEILRLLAKTRQRS